ncbi:MAG: hypothetical protein AAGB97_02845 [Dehalococcoidia bacterium]|nr:hypothetical protein [Chloroflexota bacterium]
MKLTRIKGIALLVAAVLLLTGAMGAIAAGGEERREEFRMDARYWWEAPPLTPYEREQVRGIMVLILDRYFGIDVSTMSPEEFEDLGRSIGPEREKEALRLFEHYAKKKGFQMPAGIFEMPVGIPVPGEFIPPAEVSYWWELVDPEYREARIAFFQEMFPEVNVRNMTPEEFERLLNPPPPPLRLLSIEEMKGEPAVIAVHGRARSYSTQAEIREWLNRLREVQELFGILKGLTGPSFPRITASVDPAGYVEVSLTMFEGEEMTINDALAYVPEIYALIAEKAETLDIKDVPVVFRLIRIMTGL